MKKLKIGLFIDAFFPMVDGVVVVVDNYAKRLSKIADVTVFAPKGRKEFDDSKLGYKVVRTNIIKLPGTDYDLAMPKFDKNFKKELKNADLDIVHIHSPFTIGKMGLKYGKKHNVPVIATMHSQFKQDFETRLKSKFIASKILKNIMKVFNSCNECWAVNGEISNVFVEYGAKTKPLVQNNGTDFKFYDDKTEMDLIKKKYKIEKDEKVLLFVGRIHNLKNVFFIADALKVLKEKYKLKFKMFYVGSGPDEEKLKELVEKNGLDNTFLLGKITDREELTKIYNMADLFLFPSLYDASSLVQIEAASQKTPTLFIKGAATAQTVTEDVNGFLSENNYEEYAKKISEIFADEKYYKKVQNGAFNDLFVTWDDAVKKAYNDYLRVKEKNEENK